MQETFAKHLQCARGHARCLDTDPFIQAQILPSACRLCAGHWDVAGAKQMTCLSSWASPARSQVRRWTIASSDELRYEDLTRDKSLAPRAGEVHH